MEGLNFEPMPMAALKRELTIGRQYRLIDRQGYGWPVYGAFSTDGRTRTVAKVQTNAVASSIPEQTQLNWLYFDKGDKAYRRPNGFVIEKPSKMLRLIYEWVNA